MVLATDTCYPGTRASRAGGMKRAHEAQLTTLASGQCLVLPTGSITNRMSSVVPVAPRAFIDIGTVLHLFDSYDGRI
jgi:hypothetical protein